MKKQQIVDTLKEQYTRDVRKQLVKSILNNEKMDDSQAVESSYRMLNQIFSYVLSELGWNLPDNSVGWDNTPLVVMTEAFPKLETTTWYKEQQLHVTKTIDLKSKIEE